MSLEPHTQSTRVPADLPDPLLFKAGGKVKSPETWKTKRRPEIVELFRKNVFGRMPVGRPERMRFTVTDVEPDAMEGRATRKQVRIVFGGPNGEGTLNLLLFVPNGFCAPAPCFLLICNRPPENIDPSREERSPFWPAEELIARGYAAAAFYNGEIAPDRDMRFSAGVFPVFENPGQRKADAWGTIAAWAWGASRALDYLQTDAAVDAARIAVVGHSRAGKTALWAGAEDERFAMVVSNDSGCTGASLSRGKEGERIADINEAFPYWFCANYRAFNGREETLPVDQHMLLALVAPRLLYIASATEDAWADPESEFRAAVAAGPVFRLLGKTGVTPPMPAPEAPLHEGHIGYHLRTGGHDLTLYDWSRFMDYADSHWGKPGLPAQ